MKKLIQICVLVMVVGLVPAMADTVSFTFSGPTITASGWLDLTGNDAAAGSATFSWTTPLPGGGPLTAALAPYAPPAPNTSPSGKFWYDNSLADGAFGLLFVAPSGEELNIWRANGGVASIYVSGSDYIPAGVGGWGEAGTLNVPDGGMTLMLLGGALVGLETLRRKFRA